MWHPILLFHPRHPMSCIPHIKLYTHARKNLSTSINAHNQLVLWRPPITPLNSLPASWHPLDQLVDVIHRNIVPCSAAANQKSSDLRDRGCMSASLLCSSNHAFSIGLRSGLEGGCGKRCKPSSARVMSQYSLLWTLALSSWTRG